MQTKEYKIGGLSRKYQKILICVNSLLCILSLVLIFLVACQSSPLTEYLYIVQSGDSLSSIAKTSGVSAEKIMKFNKLDSESLVSGQILNLPGVSHLKRGEKMQQLSITTREEWAAEKAGTLTQALPYNRITIHHTTDNPDFPKKSNAVFARVIQKYHQNEKKWSDIAYHYLIGKDGEILEGRSLNSLGAHVRNQNNGNIGIALLGDFQRDKLTVKQKESLKQLIRALQERFDMPRDQLYGHKDLGDTSCPGKYGWAFVQTLK